MISPGSGRREEVYLRHGIFLNSHCRLQEKGLGRRYFVEYDA